MKHDSPLAHAGRSARCASSLSSERKIPTYAADGRRLRDYSLAAIERLESLSLVVVRRLNGRIRCALFRGLMGANPLRATAHAGTRYSFLRRSGEVRLWEHAPLVQRQEIEALFEGARSVEDARLLDRFVRAIFLAVPLSCLVSPRRAANVVSIDEGRHEQKPRRRAAVVSIDEGRRAA